MADQFWERVDLGRLERLGLGDQVLVARRAGHGNQVDADRGSRRVVVRGGELVDDGRHASRRVLSCLRRLDRLSRDQHFYCDSQDISP